MAREVITKLIDDIDGSAAAETVKFGLDGLDFEIDLSAKNAKTLRKELAAYIEKGTRLSNTKLNGGTRRGGSRSTATRANRDQNQAIREWAESIGLPVAQRGRIPLDVIERFHAEAGKGTKAASQTAVKTVTAPVGGSPKGGPKKAVVRAPRGQQIKGTKAEKEDLLQQVKTWASNHGLPEVAASLTVASLSEALVDAYSEGDRRAFEDAFSALTKTVAFSNR